MVVNRPIKEKSFIDNESGISSEAIEGCQSAAELLNWKLIIDSNIATTQMNIDAIKGKQAATGEYMDPVKWAGINGYRRVLGFLSQKIQFKMRELNYDKQNKSEDSIVLFKRVAKKMLTGAQYDLIIEEVKKMEIENEKTI